MSHRSLFHARSFANWDYLPFSPPLYQCFFSWRAFPPFFPNCRVLIHTDGFLIQASLFPRRSSGFFAKKGPVHIPPSCSNSPLPPPSAPHPLTSSWRVLSPSPFALISFSVQNELFSLSPPSTLDQARESRALYLPYKVMVRDATLSPPLLRLEPSPLFPMRIGFLYCSL